MKTAVPLAIAHVTKPSFFSFSLSRFSLASETERTAFLTGRGEDGSSVAGRGTKRIAIRSWCLLS